MRGFVVAQSCVAFIAFVIWTTGRADEAGIFASIASVAVLLAAVLHIVVQDPLNKWPGVSPLTRLGNLFTFKR